VKEIKEKRVWGVSTGTQNRRGRRVRKKSFIEVGVEKCRPLAEGFKKEKKVQKTESSTSIEDSCDVSWGIRGTGKHSTGSKGLWGGGLYLERGGGSSKKTMQ